MGKKQVDIEKLLEMLDAEDEERNKGIESLKKQETQLEEELEKTRNNITANVGAIKQNELLRAKFQALLDEKKEEEVPEEGLPENPEVEGE